MNPKESQVQLEQGVEAANHIVLEQQITAEKEAAETRELEQKLLEAEKAAAEQEEAERKGQETERKIHETAGA